MKNSLTLIILNIVLFLYSCSTIVKEKEQTIQVANTSTMDRVEVVSVALDPIEGNYLFKSGKKILPAEFIDPNGDGRFDQAQVLVTIAAGESLELELQSVENSPQFTKQTQAELSTKQGGQWAEKEYVGGQFVNLPFLRVPDQHTDHTYFIRYEGPGWESDMMGYRFYLDWRNGVDVFGKLTKEMILQGVGQDGFDSYHEMSDWGLDLLKVGKTLGLGSIGQFRNDTLFRFQEVDSVTCQIAKNGLLESKIVTNYFGWSDGGSLTDLTSSVSIQAASPLTTHQLLFSEAIEGFCTGLAANESEQYLDETMNGYRVLATYGNFSLNNDQMGLAVILKDNAIKDVVSGAGSHVVLFEPAKELTYHFMAVWEKGVNSVKSMSEFKNMLQSEVVKLSEPLKAVVN